MGQQKQTLSKRKQLSCFLERPSCSFLFYGRTSTTGLPAIPTPRRAKLKGLDASKDASGWAARPQRTPQHATPRRTPRQSSGRSVRGASLDTSTSDSKHWAPRWTPLVLARSDHGAGVYAFPAGQPAGLFPVVGRGEFSLLLLWSTRYTIGALFRHQIEDLISDVRVHDVFARFKLNPPLGLRLGAQQRVGCEREVAVS